jgi:hypothetical protein
MKTLHVVDSNCSWIRSLAEAAAPTADVICYRVYNPRWLPGGSSDLLRWARKRRLRESLTEVFVIVPGWQRFPKTSCWLLGAKLFFRLAWNTDACAVLFTFPFYSSVAAVVRRWFPRVRIAYHAHDPFDYYSYPGGYTRRHEDRLVPLCDHVFTISDALSADFKIRYPKSDITTLGNAVDQSFLEESSSNGLSSAVFRAFRVAGGPLVGIVGQINSSYDWDLLEQVAERNPQAQLVFIGGLFEEGAITERIRSLFGRPNVHWLGPKPHEELKKYMEACDILMNPLIANAQNDRRDTLRLYDYLSTKLPVVSTPIAGVRQHGALIHVPASNEEMIRVLSVRPEPISADTLRQRRIYLAKNTWTARARQMLEIIMQEK